MLWEKRLRAELKKTVRQSSFLINDLLVFSDDQGGRSRSVRDWFGRHVWLNLLCCIELVAVRILEDRQVLSALNASCVTWQKEILKLFEHFKHFFMVYLLISKPGNMPTNIWVDYFFSSLLWMCVSLEECEPVHQKHLNEAFQTWKQSHTGRKFVIIWNANTLHLAEPLNSNWRYLWIEFISLQALTDSFERKSKLENISEKCSKQRVDSLIMSKFSNSFFPLLIVITLVECSMFTTYSWPVLLLSRADFEAKLCVKSTLNSRKTTEHYSRKFQFIIKIFFSQILFMLAFHASICYDMEEPPTSLSRVRRGVLLLLQSAQWSSPFTLAKRALHTRENKQIEKFSAWFMRFISKATSWSSQMSHFAFHSESQRFALLFFFVSCFNWWMKMM